MKEWKLSILIGFSFVSIAGLMLIQAYWIRDAIEIKDLQFRQAVDQAITNVVWKLERSAADREETWKQEQLRQNRLKRQLLDSIMQMQETFEEVPVPALMHSAQPIQLNRDVIGSIPEVPSPVETSHDSAKVVGVDSGSEQSVDEFQDFRFDLFSDSLIGFINRTIEHNTRFVSIRDYLEELFETDPGPGKKDPEDFLDSVMLYNMIDVELQSMNIKAPFRYAVYAPFTGKVLFERPEFVEDIAQGSGFVYHLFPNFKLSKPIHLILTFPDQKTYLFSNLGKVMSLSLVLTLLLIWSLYFIIRNTYKQKKLGEMKNDFINNMTHEFKTPVSTISLACEAMRDIDVEKSGFSMDNYLKIIDEENKRLGKLAEQILQTALVDKGQLYLLFEVTNLQDLIKQVIDKYRPAIELSRGEIKTKLFAENPVLSGDKTHLYNMISNLLDNAIKYSDAPPRIEILTTGTTSDITMSIQDEGIGISKANQKRIFEKLYRVPTGNVHNAKGFGLGLSYVKYIVERHQGRIRVESEPGKGSRFIITLPRNSIPIQE
jgi:two-component system, OmpR family, phosphate regulon sensor histidine kinase PhoR